MVLLARFAHSSVRSQALRKTRVRTTTKLTIYIFNSLARCRFARTTNDVKQLLRVCDVTVKSRVMEFEQTPSAKLSLEKFHQQDLAAECDPPSFTRNRREEGKKAALASGDNALIQSAAELVDPLAPKTRDKGKVKEKKSKEQEMYSALEGELKEQIAEAQEEHDQMLLEGDKPGAGAGAGGKEKGAGKKKRVAIPDDDDDDDDEDDDDDDEEKSSDDEDVVVAKDPSSVSKENDLADDSCDSDESSVIPDSDVYSDMEDDGDDEFFARTERRQKRKEKKSRAAERKKKKEEKKKNSGGGGGGGGGSSSSSSSSGTAAPQGHTGRYDLQNAQTINMDKWVEDLPVGLNSTLDGLLCSKDEVKEREKIFEDLNADYIEKMTRKKLTKKEDDENKERKQLELEKQQKEEDVYNKVNKAGFKQGNKSQSKGGAKSTSFASNVTGGGGGSSSQAGGRGGRAGAVGVERDLNENLQSRRKVSRKINYSALSKLFSLDTGSFKTPNTDKKRQREDDDDDDDDDYNQYGGGKITDSEEEGEPDPPAKKGKKKTVKGKEKEKGKKEAVKGKEKEKGKGKGKGKEKEKVVAKAKNKNSNSNSKVNEISQQSQTQEMRWEMSHSDSDDGEEEHFSYV